MNYIFPELKNDWCYFYKNKIIIEVKYETYELIFYNEKFTVNTYLKMEKDYNDYSKNVFYPILIIDGQMEYKYNKSIPKSLQIINKFDYKQIERLKNFEINTLLLANIDNFIDFSGFFKGCHF